MNAGFEAFDDARRRFDVRFYLVAILFIIFDLEVAFLFPWAVTLGGYRDVRLPIDARLPWRFDGRLYLTSGTRVPWSGSDAMSASTG